MKSITDQLGWSPAQFAEAIGASRGHIYALLSNGRLKARKSGRRTIITREDAIAYLDSLPEYEAPQRKEARQ